MSSLCSILSLFQTSNTFHIFYLSFLTSCFIFQNIHNMLKAKVNRLAGKLNVSTTKTLQELRMLSRSLSDCQSPTFNVIIQV